MLQVKQALPSVITAGVTPNETTPRTLPPDAPQGLRVVAHQHILQAVSDPFLGHLEVADQHYYVRQFRDMKGSLDISRMGASQFAEYVTACARLLARAHSQSPLVHWVAGYLGRSAEFDHAVVDWSFAYARAGRGRLRRLHPLTGSICRGSRAPGRTRAPISNAACSTGTWRSAEGAPAHARTTT